MSLVIDIKPEDLKLIKQKALQWANQFEVCSYFDSNNFKNNYSNLEGLICAGQTHQLELSCGTAFKALNDFLKAHPTLFIPGFLGYDLKNEIENLNSSNLDKLLFPDGFFFIPQHIVLIYANKLEVHSKQAKEIWEEINQTSFLNPNLPNKKHPIQSRFSKAEYMDTVNQIKSHINRGDIYEMNFCQEFFSENIDIDPVSVFNLLNDISPTPFSAYFKFYDKYILSASPERFLQKENGKLISQPIKGTAARNADPQKDKESYHTLKNNPKEKAENVMIVDLVRNDLTKSALPGTVNAEELFEIHSFEQVYQMISTVTCDADPKLSNSEIIRNTFPMGSMTGAPKIEAMKLIEKFEQTKRGVFSGAIGYFSPHNNFDFNVVIRTVLYNATQKYLSFQVGGAITFDSDPEAEYAECLLKASAILKVLA